jgi:hypothetical protein
MSASTLRRERFINKLRELDYHFARQTDRTYVWRRGVHHVYVPQKELLPLTYVRQTLKQCGLSESDIEMFIGTATA